eukprot:321209_1
MTHAQYIVKAAKEREELQAKGDILDTKIKQLEKGARKLDRATGLMKACNSKYKEQFKRVDPNDPEQQSKQFLADKNRQLQSLVNRRTADMHEFLRQQVSKVAELQDLAKDKADAENKLQILREGLAHVTRDVQDAAEAKQRYDQMIGKLRRKISPEHLQDIDFREFKDTLDQAILSLISVADAATDPAYAATVN